MRQMSLYFPFILSMLKVCIHLYFCGRSHNEHMLLAVLCNMSPKSSLSVLLLIRPKCNFIPVIQSQLVLTPGFCRSLAKLKPEMVRHTVFFLMVHMQREQHHCLNSKPFAVLVPQAVLDLGGSPDCIVPFMY